MASQSDLSLKRVQDKKIITGSGTGASERYLLDCVLEHARDQPG